MASQGISTPQKISMRNNSCVICGFSFINIEISPTGEVITRKLFKQKLKLKHEVISAICSVIDNFSVDKDIDKDNGICIKCFRKVESVNKLRNDAANLQAELMASRVRVVQTIHSLPSPRKFFTEKRLLRSPVCSQKPKQIKTFPTSVQRVALCQIPTFATILKKATPKKEAVHQPTETQTIPAETQTMPPVKQWTTQGIIEQNLESAVIDKWEGAYHLITVFYPSMKKASIIKNESHRTICKAILRGTNADTVIVDSLCTSNPMAVVQGCKKIVEAESKNIAKRGSGSVLQKKDYNDFFNFKWEDLNDELKAKYPALLSVITSIVSSTPMNISVPSKPFLHIMLTAAVGLHGRNQEMSVIQFMTGLILTHGGCTQRDIARLSHIGLSVHPTTIHRKLSEWQEFLDKSILEIKEKWEDNGQQKYQLVGDNWDRNILPSYRTSDRSTLSLHLFNMYAIVDRVQSKENTEIDNNQDIDQLVFLPSIEEQQILKKELTFIVSTSIINCHPQMNKLLQKIYPSHLEHKYTQYAGVKTRQFPLGLFDCNENKTPEVIKLLKDLSTKYVPCKDGNITEAVFFGGDRLTDERIQSAQNAMANGHTALDRLEGFISKIEDFHRLMNFLEAIHKMTYSTESVADKCTVHYFRNLLNMRNVKGKICNAYRAYKMLYYTILDAICLCMLLKYFAITDIEQEIKLPEGFVQMTNNDKINWIDNISQSILEKWFFCGKEDIFEHLKDIVGDANHPENYWVSTLEDGRLKCHHCDNTYAYVGSLRRHEMIVHNVKIEKPKAQKKAENQDELHNYTLMLFKLVLLHKNLDTAVDMGDGERCVRSAKYELPIYNRTNKVKYLIGSIHLTALTSGMLPPSQAERLIANRFVNLQGGVNNNISLDEYLEMLNRDTKVACSGHQTKESILQHSKEYPHLVNFINQFDNITQITGRKGFHHLPSYQKDVLKVAKDLHQEGVLEVKPKRTLKCKEMVKEQNPFINAFNGLRTLIYRHKPEFPYHRLRDKHI